MTAQSTRPFRVKSLAELPFYCHPVYLFIAIWIAMLGALELQVSQATYDDRSLGISLFIVSVLSLWMGFAITRKSDKSSRLELQAERYSIRIQPLRKIILLLGAGSMLLVIFNLIVDGLPPVASFLGFQTMDYQEYGRFKQALQPMLSALFLNAMLESSRWRRWFWSAFSLGIMVAYVLRGPLLMAMAQAVVLWSIRTPLPKKTIYIRAFIILCVALALITVIGNYRTPQQIFFEVMQIKPEYRSWPMALLWPISYISVPISNLCWIIHGAHFTEPTLSFLYPVLPSFWAPANPHDIPLSDSHVIDGVHTYLSAYYLDFSWVGIVAVNFGLGVLSAFLVNRERISRLLLISPIFLSAIGLIFFWDFFIYLPTLGQLAIQAAVHKRCILRGRSRRRIPLLLNPRPNPAT
jgi:oligosaccharide repeat unit polymerase